MKDNGVIRVASTGANRNSSKGKINYVGCISPLVTRAYGEYIESHAVLPDGTYRDTGNWKKLFGTPKEHQQICLESLYRHFIDILLEYDGYESRDGLDEALGGAFFNIQALWYGYLKEKQDGKK
jgi:hypothetical protein